MLPRTENLINYCSLVIRHFSNNREYTMDIRISDELRKASNGDFALGTFLADVRVRDHAPPLWEKIEETITTLKDTYTIKVACSP